MDVGIDDFAIHFPRLYFDMKDFAKFRGADFEKLNKIRIEDIDMPNKKLFYWDFGDSQSKSVDMDPESQYYKQLTNTVPVSYTHLTLPTILLV